MAIVIVRQEEREDLVFREGPETSFAQFGLQKHMHQLCFNKRKQKYKYFFRSGLEVKEKKPHFPKLNEFPKRSDLRAKHRL